VDSRDREEFDRLYDRLVRRFAGPNREEEPADPIALISLQRLMDRVRAQEENLRDTDPMPDLA
jgi:hypothetical protein